MIEQYNKTITFYLSSLFIPWILWFSVAWLSHRPEQNMTISILQPVLGILGLVVPVFVALFLCLKNRLLFEDVKGRIFNIQGYKPVYLFYTVFLILLSMIAAQCISLLFGHSLNQFYISGKPTFTSTIFSPWGILILAPVAEELAWHSYGTDTLRRKFNLFNTSMIFSVFWVFWHLPLSFIKGYYHSNVVAEGPLYAVNFMVSLFVFVILMNWLYYKTNRSILTAILFHLSANISNEIFATHPDSKVIQTGILLIVTIVALVKDREMFFGRGILTPK